MKSVAGRDSYLHVVFVHGKDPLAETLGGLRGVADFVGDEVGIGEVNLANLLHRFHVDVVLRRTSGVIVTLNYGSTDIQLQHCQLFSIGNIKNKSCGWFHDFMGYKIMKLCF